MAILLVMLTMPLLTIQSFNPLTPPPIMKKEKNPEQGNIICCFSAGRTSAYMTKKLIEYLECKPYVRNGIDCHLTKYGHFLYVVFNNTGKEREESLQFVKDCDDNFGFRTVWLEAVTNPVKGKGVTPKVVTFEAMIAKIGIPNQARSKCTSELKTNNTNAFRRKQGLLNSWQAVGIRADEPKRLNFEKSDKFKVFYPLATMFPTSKYDVNYFWSKQSFDLNLKSYEGNCDLCWKKSMRKLMTIAVEHPELTDWWVDIENKYGMFIPEGHNSESIKLPRTFYRKYESMEDIIEESKFQFEKSIDESKIIDGDKMLTNWSYELDTNDGCVESCEAF